MSVRTTVTLEDDVAAEVDRLKRDQGLGVSEALNQLARRGLMYQPPEEPYVMPTKSMGAKIDVTCTGEVLAYLDEIEGKHSSW